MPSDTALQIAARAWTTPETSSIEFDPVLATAFAEIVDEIRQTNELVEKFVAAYDDWIGSPEFLHGSLFQAMLDARDELGGRKTEQELSDADV